MKKKVFLLMIGLCLLVLAGGCKKKDLSSQLDTGSDTTATTGTPTTGAVPTTAPAPVKEAYVASDYVTLGQYKGIEVTVQKLEVTDADIDAAIQSDLAANATYEDVTDRPVQNGDTVNIDYEGLKDGVAFEGGTDQGYDLEIGSGSFIPGFEEGLIGAKTGDKVALDITFPADYQATDLAGQPVVFNVTINSIKKSVTPELTEDYVKNNTDYDSIAAYKDAKRADLEAQNEDTMNNDKVNAVMQQVVANATVSSIPQNLLDYYAYNYKAYMEQMLNYIYGTTLSDYLTTSGISQEEFDSNVQEIAKQYATSEMVKKAIAETEGMKITEDDYQQLLPQYLTDNGVDSETTLQQYETKDATMENMLLKNSLDFVVNQAVVTETTATPTPAPTVAP